MKKLVLEETYFSTCKSSGDCHDKFYHFIGTCEDDVKYAASCPGWANSGGCTKNRVSKVVAHYEILLTQSKYVYINE